ncbi:MAG: GtrA family protein [Cyanobacteria bacterium P01_D01_bin.36]
MQNWSGRTFASSRKLLPIQKPTKRDTRQTANQLFRYLFVGGAAMIVDVSMFAVFSKVFLIDYRVAVVLGFACGVATNFSLCNWIVFRGKLSPLWLVFARHCAASLYALLANEIVMISLVEFLSFKNLILAKIISSGVAFIFNFAIKKLYVYNTAYYQKSYRQSQQAQDLRDGLGQRPERNLNKPPDQRLEPRQHNKSGKKIKRRTRR